ncbi:hypothetical protein [Pontibacter sp. G13]|uniref:hypothetical protein n=1 Tax=Pontibacter sp. G13 TaxID=3074898 RepID=UPI00288B86B1|nr:hypothetical protein [Pontibacter sp. G13]WNJ18378.1 hypothetical protein RJD25_26285 [Pontibacter sp. G13]
MKAPFFFWLTMMWAVGPNLSGLAQTIPSNRLESIRQNLETGDPQEWKFVHSHKARRLLETTRSPCLGNGGEIRVRGNYLVKDLIEQWSTFDLEFAPRLYNSSLKEKRAFFAEYATKIQFDSALQLYHIQDFEDWAIEVEWQQLTAYEIAVREQESKLFLARLSQTHPAWVQMVEDHDPMILALIAEKACLDRQGIYNHTAASNISTHWSPFQDGLTLPASAFVLLEGLTHIRMQTWGRMPFEDSLVWNINPSHDHNHQEVITAMIFFRQNAHHFVWNDSLQIFEWDELDVKPNTPVRELTSQMNAYQSEDPFSQKDHTPILIPALRAIAQVDIDSLAPILDEYDNMVRSYRRKGEKVMKLVHWGNDLRNAGFIFSEQTLSHPALIELQTHPKSYIPKEVVAEIPRMSWEEIQIMSLEGWLRRFDSWQKEPFEEELDAWYWNYLWESCTAAIEFETPHRPIRGGHRYPVELMPHQPRIVHSEYKWLIPPPYLPIAQLGVFNYEL